MVNIIMYWLLFVTYLKLSYLIQLPIFVMAHRGPDVQLTCVAQYLYVRGSYRYNKQS